jgi:hypothetical protein
MNNCTSAIPFRIGPDVYKSMVRSIEAVTYWSPHTETPFGQSALPLIKAVTGPGEVGTLNE